MRLIYHPDAESEVIEAARYYESRVATLGVQFLNEADRAVAMILEAPAGWRSSRKASRPIQCLAFHTPSTIAIFPAVFTFLLSNIIGSTLITGDIAFPNKALTLYRPSLFPA
jgi:hypothetical protein